MQIDMDSVPATVAVAVDQLFHSLEEDDIKFIESNPVEAVHHTVGMSVRNAWSLWEPDSPLKRDAVEKYGIAHADDISGLIFAWLYAKVRREDFAPAIHAQRYHRHWERQGTDALTAGGWPPHPNSDGVES